MCECVFVCACVCECVYEYVRMRRCMCGLKVVCFVCMLPTSECESEYIWGILQDVVYQHTHRHSKHYNRSIMPIFMLVEITNKL